MIGTVLNTTLNLKYFFFDWLIDVVDKEKSNLDIEDQIDLKQKSLVPKMKEAYKYNKTTLSIR